MAIVTVGTGTAPAAARVDMREVSANAVGWGEMTLRSLPSLFAVGATVFGMESPGPRALVLQIVAGIIALMPWLPLNRKHEA